MSVKTAFQTTIYLDKEVLVLLEKIKEIRHDPSRTQTITALILEKATELCPEAMPKDTLKAYH